jgi:hypothetical protein
MVSFNIGLTENITLEGFYQFKWEKTIIDPRGTYFSTNDVVSRGSDKMRPLDSFHGRPILKHPTMANMDWHCMF